MPVRQFVTLKKIAMAGLTDTKMKSMPVIERTFGLRGMKQEELLCAEILDEVAKTAFSGHGTKGC